MEPGRPIIIVLADDDEDDRLLVRDALAESRLRNELHTVKDGEELMDYLHRRGDFTHLHGTPLPGVILLDLNMPRKSGREALVEIKSDPGLRRIPVVILTTSRAEEDIVRSYDTGANSYVPKPVTFPELVKVMQALGRYWIEIVELPSDHEPPSYQRGEAQGERDGT